MSQTVVVTGASGFIGRHVCRRLARDGWRVRALTRSSRAEQRLDGLAHEAVRGDLFDTQALRELVTGCTAVVHCAGAVRGATQSDFERVNLEGTQRLVTAVLGQSPPPRVLHLSSLAAREPGLSFYAASKRAAEDVVRDAGANFPWLVLRPPAVYGPGDREMLPLFKIMGRGIAPVFGEAQARFSMLFAADLAEAIAVWLRHDDPPRGVFALHDGRRGGYDWAEVSAIVSQLCGRRVRRVQVPAALLSLPAHLNAVLARWLDYAPMLTPEKLRELRHPDWVCDNADIASVLDWQPASQLGAGLRATPGWCGRLPQA